MYKKIARVINIICILILVCITVFFFMNYSSLPAEVPRHFNAAGEIDNYGSAANIIMMLVLSWLIWSFTSFIELLPKFAGSKDVAGTDDPWIISAVLSMVSFVKLVAVCGISYITYCMIKVQNLGSRFMLIFLLSMFAPMIITGLVCVFRKK